MEKNSAEPQTKQKKGLRAYFKKKWKAIKSTFSRSGNTEVVPLSTELDQNPSDPQTGPSVQTHLRVFKTTVEKDPAVDLPGSCNLDVKDPAEEDSPGIEPTAPEHLSDPSIQQQRKGKKQKKGMRASCKKKWKTIKSTFSHSRNTEVVPLSTQLDLNPSDSLTGPTVQTHLRVFKTAVEQDSAVFLPGSCNRDVEDPAEQDSPGIEPTAPKDPSDHQPRNQEPRNSQHDSAGSSLDHTTPAEDPAEQQTDPPNNNILSEAEILRMFQHVSDLSLSGILKEKVKTMNVILEIRSCQYKINKMLGEGGYGAVFEGIRVSDSFKVAVKVVSHEDCLSRVRIDGYSKPLPREIAFHMLASKKANVPEIIQLLAWEDWDKEYIMVLERPSPCMDLCEYFDMKFGEMTERLVRIIMWQTTKAAIECLKQGVFHRDIKLDNLLINPETFKVKLIDFGCGDLLQKTPYTTFLGTEEYCCPEFYDTGEYHAKPATVWSLGIVMFVLLLGTFPDENDLHLIQNKMWQNDCLTKECCRLIQDCLQENPKHRIPLQKIQTHRWFHVRGKIYRNEIKRVWR